MYHVVDAFSSGLVRLCFDHHNMALHNTDKRYPAI